MTGESLARLMGIVGWKVKGEPLFCEGKEGPHVMMELVREQSEYKCPCGRQFTRYYDGEYREVRDLSWGLWGLSLLFYQVRVECPECGVKTEHLEWLTPGQRYTKRFATFVAGFCRLASVKAVADYLGLDWKTVKRIDKEALELELDPPNLEGLRLLAVDEIAIKKGHKYATVVLDFETRRVVWVGEGHSTETLSNFYKLLGKERCEQIAAVAMDMWPAFENATREYCPEAEVVFDKFHVVGHFSKVLDQVRNAEIKRARKEDKPVFKGTKYLLLRNSNKLAPKQKGRLQELLNLNESLNTVYILKEDLKQLWDFREIKDAWKFFMDWYQTAMASKIQPLQRMARMLRKHWQGLSAHCLYPIHTSVLEGVNNKAKVIKRVAFGYLDSAYFFLKLRQAFPGKHIPSFTY